MNQMQHLIKGVIIAMLLLAPVWLWAAEPAGYVLMATGEVVAVQEDQVTRPLQRKSPFYSGESLRTGADARAQVRFRDGSLISLRPDTEIRIDDFRYQQGDEGGDRNIFTLINGGFRTITGKIGKKDPRNYQMKSSVASIGVRGTTYEVVLDNGLNVAAWQGSIVVENPAGAITLGSEGVFNFAHVAGTTVRPLGLLKPPAVIGDAFEARLDPSAEPALEGAEDAAPGDEDRDTNITQSTDSEGGEGLPRPRMISNDGDATIDATRTPIFEPAISATADLRLDGVNLTRVGMAQTVDYATAGFDYLIAPSGLDSNGDPVFADTGFAPGQADFYTATASTVLRRGSAPLVTSYDHPNLGVSWGIWDGVAQPVELATDASDPSIVTGITRPLHWLTVAATDATTISGRSGQFNYRNVLAFDGIGSDGNLNDLYMNLAVDFDTAAVSGDMHLYTTNEFWDIALAGTVSAQGLDISSVSGTVNGSQSVTGRADLMFAGSSAEALAGMVSFEAALDPSVYLDSMLLVDNTASGDLRLGAVTLDRAGLVLESNALAGAHYRSGSAAGSAPVFAETGLLPGAVGFDTATIINVIGQGGASSLNSYNDPGYAISWGIWDSGASLQTDRDDPLVTTTLADPLLWMSVHSTPDTVLGGLSGAAYYHSAPVSPAVQGMSNAGLGITGLNADLEVDFDLARFKGQLALVTGVSDTWNLAFEGNLVGPRLEVSSMTGSYSGAGGSGAAAGNLFMVLSGVANPDAIAGAFDLEYAADPNYYVQGNFIAERDLRLSFAEAADMNRVVLGAIGSAGSHVTFTGRSTGDASPVIGLSSFHDPGQPEFWFQEANEILRQDSAPDLVVAQATTAYQMGTPDPAYEVSWGAWNGQAAPFSKQTDLIDPSVASAENVDLFWISLTPTPVDAISGTPAGRTGMLTYQQVNAGWTQGWTAEQISATPTSGLIDGTNFGFYASVDFDTGATSGNLGFNDSAGKYWNAAFSGTLNGSELVISAPTVYYDVYTATGEIQAMFTGPNAEGMAGSFDFDYLSGTATAEGVFLVNCSADSNC